MPSFMKSRQWLITSALLVLALAAIVATFLTRDLGTIHPAPVAKEEAAPVELVDETPLQTARTMGKLATDDDQKQVAEQAERLADEAVDLAFHDASRQAADHPPQAKAEFHELFQHAGEVDADVNHDQNQVKDLQKQLAAANGQRQVSLQEQLDVAQAQLELDQDELADAKEDLVRSGADPGALIQRQFQQHQASEHSGNQQTALTAGGSAEINYRADNLLAQLAAWRALHTKIGELELAKAEAAKSAASLSKSHDALEKQVSAEKKSLRAASLQMAPAPTAAGQPQSASAQTVKALHLLSDDQKTLADLDKRVQDEQELENTYGTWITLVQSHARTAVHGIVLSALWIVLIVLCVYLTDRAVDRHLSEVATERTRLHTLRAVIRFAVQAIGVLLILLVVLGAPNQMPTIIGLAGAGLTVAMKDFIVAFFGWFVLMGKNGIRVGDWVEINGVAGEVIEINLFRTVLLETGNWTSTGHPTGRKVSFVNTYAIEGHFFNFTTSGQWLWDEIQLLVPADQDPYTLIDQIQQAVVQETEASVREAEEEWKRVTNRYRVRAVSAAPAVNLRPTPSGIEVHVRYICRANERYALRARLNQALVRLLRRKEIDDKPAVSAATL
jgi:small-conductance mechanosensitive channel